MLRPREQLILVELLIHDSKEDNALGRYIFVRANTKLNLITTQIDSICTQTQTPQPLTVDGMIYT
jgi:hypothetical protein